MPNSMRRKWTKPASLTLEFVAAAIDSTARAELLDEPHLVIVPRTGDESARIEAAATPAADFGAPQEYEAMSAGAATIRVGPNADSLFACGGQHHVRG